MIDKSASLSTIATAAAAALAKEGSANLGSGAGRAMLEKAATGFPSSPSAVTMPLPPNPGTLAVQITLSAAAVARLANKPETVNRTATPPAGIALDQRQSSDPRASGIPVPVEQAKEQLPQGDRPIPQTVKALSEEPQPHEAAADPARPAANPNPSGPATAPTAEKTVPPALAGGTPQPLMSGAKEATVAPQTPHSPVAAASTTSPSERLIGLVTESTTPGRTIVLTAQGPVALPMPLPAGSRVEIALSSAGALLLSVLSGPAAPPGRRDDVRTGRGRTTPSPADNLGTKAPDDGVLPADHRLGAALMAMGKELLSRADQETLPTGADAAPTVLWFGTPQNPVPLSMETVPLLDEDGAGANGKKRRSTRFRFGLRLDGIGALQLDGMVRRQRFDLRVRTEIALASTLQQEIEGIFHEALSLGGIAGSIAFAGTPGTWGQAHVMVSPVTA